MCAFLPASFCTIPVASCSHPSGMLPRTVLLTPNQRTVEGRYQGSARKATEASRTARNGRGSFGRPFHFCSVTAAQGLPAPRPALVVAYDAYRSCVSCYAHGQVSGCAAQGVTACPWTASTGMHAMSRLSYKHIPRQKTCERYKRAVASHDVQLATPCKWHMPGCAGALLGNCKVAASRLLAHACSRQT